MKRHQLIQRVINKVYEEDQEEMKTYGFENVQVQHWAIEAVESWAA